VVRNTWASATANALAEAGVEPSVGSRSDRYDNALAETINGLYKAEPIHRRAPWKTRQSLELATLEWGPGLTINACIRLSAISFPPRLRQTISIVSTALNNRPSCFNQMASAITGAGQLQNER